MSVFMTVKEQQKLCAHVYEDYATIDIGESKVKVWRKCRICCREFTYIRRSKELK